jgi:hypothetical protein
VLGDVLGELEEFLEGDWSRVFREGSGGGFEELVAEFGEGGDARLELQTEGFVLGAQGQDATVVGLVSGNWSWLAEVHFRRWMSSYAHPIHGLVRRRLQRGRGRPGGMGCRTRSSRQGCSMRLRRVGTALRAPSPWCQLPDWR